MRLVGMHPRILSLRVAMLCYGGTWVAAAELTPPHFRAVNIDTQIEIGYGVTVADIDGDHKPDILLADKKQIVWYRNPGWEKFVLAENLTPLDDVCVAAADIDGDGKAEVAVGAQWNPSDTTTSGAVFYLIPSQARTQKWKAVELPHEPTVHRMKWIRDRIGDFRLIVVPLHGRGNENGAGAGVRILSYKKPAEPEGSWQTALIDSSLHMTHNLEPVQWNREAGTEFLVAAKEGVFLFSNEQGRWRARQIVGPTPGQSGFAGAGEVRAGKLRSGKAYVVTVEPMHGNQVAAYTEPVAEEAGLWQRHVLDDTVKEGHALACGDLLGAGFDQVVVGWRGKDKQGKVGIKLFFPRDADGSSWEQVLLDDNGVACEDLCLADLNGDGRLDIVASGRASRNLKVYFNEGAKPK